MSLSRLAEAFAAPLAVTLGILMLPSILLSSHAPSPWCYIGWAVLALLALAATGGIFLLLGALWRAGYRDWKKSG